MKYLPPLLYVVCLCLLSFGSYAQQNENCFINDCNTNALDVSTGVDHNTGTLYNDTDPATDQDAFWQLINAPATQNVNFGPAWVIEANPAWTTTSSSQWISAFNVDNLNVDNDPPENPYTFQRCFCVCEDTELTFDMVVYADDQVADIWLDGTMLIPTPAYTVGSTAHFTNGVPVQVTVPVTAGEHCLSIDVRNRSGVAMGLMVTGRVIGANLLTSQCCDNSGSICGFKFEDTNQNGVWDPGESPIENWTIEVSGPGGTFTQQTDENGNYCFNGLAPGNYTVSEVNQTGWIQSFPTSPSFYPITLGPNEVVSGANFGNYFDEGCVADECNTNVLDVSTGVDHNTGSLYPATDPATAQDAFWQLTNAPASQTVNFGPAWVIDNNPAWTTTPTSEWISAFNVDNLNADNDPPENPYTFQRCFCVCEDTELTFDMMVYADDQVADIWLDGGLLIPTPAYTVGSTAHFTSGIPVNVTVPVTAGEHCMSIDIRNRSGVAMGLMVTGNVLGANLLTSVCCNPGSSVCGFKFNDSNQNGVWDAGESALENWTIQITGPGGTFTQQTDENGNYCFNGLPAGNYTVSEVNQPGWTQSFPTGSGTHSVTLGTNEVASDINFGNYEPQPEPCDLKARYKIRALEGCYLELLDISFLSSGDIVCTEWDFGDGTTTTGGPNVNHYYTAPGVYDVCLTVLAIVDGECCEDRYCQKIVVEGCEPEPCKIRVDFDHWNQGCLFTFDGTIITANRDIDVWYWDFGDGTTGNGQQVNHVYSPGSYVVCLTAIVKSEEEGCCIDRICKEIFVEDCPQFDQNQPDALEEQDQGFNSNAPATMPIQLYPNPATDVLHLKTQLSGTYQITIFNTAGEQVYSQSANQPLMQLSLQKMGLSAGVYVIELDNGTQRLREKFAFQK